MTTPDEPDEDWRGLCLDLVLLLVAVDVVALELYLLTR